MPLQRRLPKRGFTNIFKKQYALIHIDDLNRFKKDEVVDVEALKKAGLVNKLTAKVKILGDGELKNALTVKAHKFSESARKKIEAASGKIEVIQS